MMFMTHFKKTAALLMAASLMSAAFAFSAIAGSKEKVGRIELTVESDIRVGSNGGEVEVTATGDNTDKYYVDSAELINDQGDDWLRSNPPEVEVILEIADEDLYTFSGTSSSNFRLTLGKGSKSHFDRIRFESASKQEGTLTLKFQLIFDDDADIRDSEAPSNVRWDDTKQGMALWGDVSASKYFQVQLYKDGVLLNDASASTSEIYSVYATSFDFSPYFTGPGNYQFKVRSVRASNNAKSHWISSEVLTIGSESGGSWRRAADQIRWWWENDDGSYAASQWKQINGLWYHFDSQGYMETGWITVDGRSYYLDLESGAMYANCRTPDNYWVDESGAWVPGK